MNNNIKAEEKSYSVCEETGSEVEVGTWTRGWIQTLCLKAALKRYYNGIENGEIMQGTKFEDVWKAKEASATIVTKKKK